MEGGVPFIPKCPVAEKFTSVGQLDGFMGVLADLSTLLPKVLVFGMWQGHEMAAIAVAIPLPFLQFRMA